MRLTSQSPASSRSLAHKGLITFPRDLSFQWLLRGIHYFPFSLKKSSPVTARTLRGVYSSIVKGNYPHSYFEKGSLEDERLVYLP